MYKNLDAKRDFMEENINEIMLIDTRAKRLLSYIIKHLGLGTTLNDKRIELFVMSLAENDEPDYDILTDIVMDIKGLNVKPLDYLTNRKERIFTKDEVVKIIPSLSEYFHQIPIRSNYTCGDGFMIKIEGDYFKIFDSRDRRLFDPIFVRR